MRLGAISDLHVDINRKHFQDFYPQLKKYLDSLDLDVLLIPGDIAGMNSEIKRFMVETSTLDIPNKLYVPGNHCLWTNTTLTSWDLYFKVLPELSRLTNWHYLPGNPTIIEDVAFIGSPGWYNYSTRNKKYDESITMDIYRSKIYETRIWNDLKYVRFGKSDEEVSSYFLGQLELDYFSIFGDQVDPPFNSLVLSTHVVPYQELVEHKNQLNWDFFSAFIGCADIGKWFDTMCGDLNTKNYAIFGHSHYPINKILESGVRAHCVPLGYPHETKSDDLIAVLNERVLIVDI